MTAPKLAIVGATGLLGPRLVQAFLDHGLAKQELSLVRILTTNASNPKLPNAEPGLEIAQISYNDGQSLKTALSGIDVLVSAIGFQADRGSYEANKAALIEAAASAGVKIYVPSEFGTDHSEPSVQAIGSAIFASKKPHHERAEQLGLKVFAFYTGLFLEPIWDICQMPISAREQETEWIIPKPERKVAFTSLNDIGRFVLSAVVQAYEGATNIPSRLRLASDSVTIDEAANLFESASGKKVRRVVKDMAQLQRDWDEAKPTIPIGRLGPAIQLMMSQRAFDYSTNCQNDLLLRGRFAFEPRTVSDYFRSLSYE